MLFGVEETQERFEELMARAAAGEEILIGEGNRTARLILIAVAQELSAVADKNSNIEDSR
jgi:antitoxin (DNA-binding transcriptional repressor) of toxin-antitoxin stability system